MRCRTFEVDYDFFGEVRTAELLPGGSRMTVTAANRQQYVQLYTQWLLETSVAKQFNAFSHGFHQVCVWGGDGGGAGGRWWGT